MIRAAVLFILFATMLAPDALLASAEPPWIDTGDVRRGMRGTGRTVVRGVAVESFDVEALAVMPRAGPAGDLILIRVSGPLIQRTGGIASGMSGSPVYLNGRLAGAIGFGWNFTDHTLGLVTPIRAMSRLLAPGAPVPRQRSGLAPVAARVPLAVPVTINGATITDVMIAQTFAAARAVDTRGGTVLPMAPVASPLLLSGLSPRAAQLLRAELDGLGVLPIETAAGASSDVRAHLVPGSAIGVQLMRGDVNAVAIGTLTYRDGDAVVGFGHQFLNRGRTAYLLTPAVIHEVVRSAVFPFKLGSAGAPIGVITEDRRAGVGGRVGTLPPMVAIRVIVNDRDRSRVGVIGTQVVRDPQLGPLFALSAALDAIDRAMDRVGEGTARVRMTLRGRGLEAPLVRENVYYHPRDIGTASLVELPEALRLLFSNEFVRTGPIDVTLEVDVDGNRQTATITEVAFARARARRGEVAKLQITVRPYQGAVAVHTVEVVVPETFPVGPATLLIRAGGRPTPEAGLAALLSGDANEPPAMSATSQLSNFSDRDRNTDVVVELVSGAARFPGGGDSAAQTVKTKITTPWVVRGRVQVSVTIDAQ